MLGLGFAATLTICPSARAAASGDSVVDPSALASLEQRANEAAPREKPYLYTQLADRLTVLAAAQLHSGEPEQAVATLEKVEACTQQIDAQVDVKSKDLKKAEMRLRETQRRLHDLARSVSGDLKTRLQETLKRINATQRSLLAVLFSH